MEKEFFLEKNKELSGSLSNEKYLKNNYPDFYLIVNSYNEQLYSKDSLKEKIYRYLNRDLQEKKCICGKSKKLISIKIGYQEFCSRSCANKNTQEKIANTKLERYGDTKYNNKSKQIISHNNNLAINKELIVEKRNKTLEERYGDPKYRNIEKIRKSKKQTTLNSIREKLLNTSIYVIDTFQDVDRIGYIVECNQCNQTIKVNNSMLNFRIRNNINPCPICYNYSSGISKKEHEIADYIRSLNIEIIRGDRKILDGLEIDILIPDKNIGFEYNGLYWHSSFNINNDYHLRKKEKALEKGINLIHIWEDDWENKTEIVKSRIRNILGISENRVFARKCKIQLVDFQTAKQFLINNHLQGFCPSKIAIGLYYENVLISLCTFGGRKISGKSENELLRFCNKIGYSIPGGFSKILKHYTKLSNSDSLITYADRCWTGRENNLYTNEGFDFIGTTKPNYWYIVDHQRQHRYKFRKDILIKEGYNPDLSESKIMEERGIYKIYDCGNYKYKLQLNKKA